MNISLIASYVIGAVVMLTIIFFNVRVSVHSGQETMHIMAKSKVDVVSQVLTNDLRKMGYGNNAQILTATATTLSFQTDFNNDGTLNVITWQYDPATAIAETENPDDRALTRTFDAGAPEDFSSLTVTRFEFFYILANGTETQAPGTGDFANIRKVRVNVICETEFGYDGVFGASAWQKVITPLNLNI
jgi:hypothetical protein